MIKKTFDFYHPQEFNKGHYNIEELMIVVENETLEAKFSIYLEINNGNILNMQSMPWLDIGDLPLTYDKKKSEAF